MLPALVAPLALSSPIDVGATTAACGAPAAGAARCPVALAPEQMFEWARQLADSGRDAAAIELLRLLTEDRNPDFRAEARVRIARLLARRGDRTGALIWYRRLLDEKPDAAAARIEFAALLAETGDLAAARRALRQLDPGALPPEVALAVDRYVQALRSRKPWGGSFELALAPDSNVNRATRAGTLDTVVARLNLSRDARQQAGIGVRQAGQLYARLDLGDRLTLVPRLSSQAVLFRAGRFNDISGAAQLGLEYRRKADRFTPALGWTGRWFGGQLFARTGTVNVAWLHPAGRRAQIDATIGLNRVRYARDRAQDGMILSAVGSYERALSARSGVSATVSTTRQTARIPGHASVAAALGGVYWHDFGRTTLFASVGGSRLAADARLPLFPRRRAEWYVAARAGAVWRRLQVAGFSPQLRVSFERNWSTVGLYAFRRVATDFGITRSF